MRSLAITALLLCSCSTSLANMASEVPAAAHHSAKSRETVADCLLDRVGSDELVPERTVTDQVTTIGFKSRGLAAQPAIYLFTIRDAGAGSVTEVRRYAHASLANAETCF